MRGEHDFCYGITRLGMVQFVASGQRALGLGNIEPGQFAIEVGDDIERDDPLEEQRPRSSRAMPCCSRLREPLQANSWCNAPASSVFSTPNFMNASMSPSPSWRTVTFSGSYIASLGARRVRGPW